MRNDSLRSSEPCSHTGQDSSEDRVHAFGRQLSLVLLTINPWTDAHSPRKPEVPYIFAAYVWSCPCCFWTDLWKGLYQEMVQWCSVMDSSCPKIQQQLPHLSLTPNYCGKGLTTSWCQQNGTIASFFHHKASYKQRLLRAAYYYCWKSCSKITKRLIIYGYHLSNSNKRWFGCYQNGKTGGTYVSL